MASTTNIIDLVRKLLRLSTSSNEHEAAAAAAKAQELLEKYNLDRAQIVDKGDQDEQYVNHQGRTVGGTKGQASWRISLLNVVAKNNFCRIVKTDTNRYTIIGKAHNIEVVEYLFAYLAGEITRLAAAGWKATTPEQRTRRRWNSRHGYVETTMSPETWKRGFAMGAVSVISQRLRQQRADFGRSSQAYGLIVRTDRELDEATRAIFPWLGKSRRSSTSASDAFHAGRAAGATIAINPGVRAATPTGALMLR